MSSLISRDLHGSKTTKNEILNILFLIIFSILSYLSNNKTIIEKK